MSIDTFHVHANCIREGDLLIVGIEDERRWLRVVELDRIRHDPESPTIYVTVIGEDGPEHYQFQWNSAVEISPSGEVLCTEMGQLVRWWVNTYEIGRAYGGPEEGGWWFDTGTPVVTVPCGSYASAERVQEMLTNKYPGNGQVGSVIYNGGDFITLIEEERGKMYPSEWPHYC